MSVYVTFVSFLSSQSKRQHLLLKFVINFSGSIFAASAVKNGVLVYISMNGETADNKSFRPKTRQGDKTRFILSRKDI